MGAFGAGANRSTAVLERLPEPVAIDQYSSLVKNPVQEERRRRFNARQAGNVYVATSDALEIDRQADRHQRPVLTKGDQQIKVGGLVLVPSRH
jgi:hypothetical protein